ncbi:MAG TPA: hypothetical protein IGS52_02870 [Oscillatoriaceae cyanobacterium M33_DOE_052]|uniref:Uncharacterized protein n=1 Tax=Planktothricoides sp. SpSt-374 TaxID=2282167 RepID=A0A7C3VFC7_9CYAN|nr:hypothetical protein [Oscillatoriaceae cyanobacterium M33_DOE_052]
MEASVREIKPIANNHFAVIILIDEMTSQFEFTVEKEVGEPMAVISGNREFCQTFKFNQHIAVEVSKLVSKIYRGAHIEFPVYVGDFASPEEAIAQQKPFQQPEATLKK